MSWPAILLWALVVPLSLAPGPALIYATLMVNVFMSLQMLPGSGGSTLLPISVYEAALAMRFLLGPGNVLRGFEAALDMRRLGLLTAFLVYGLASAIVLPRVFSGMVAVIPVAGASLDGPSLLMPRSGNFTQSGYMIVSYLVVLAFAEIGSRVGALRHIRYAILAASVAAIVTGLLDLFASRLGLGALLDAFRTANYELLTDVETAGLKRVVGLTPEASTYGSLCVQSASAILLLLPFYARGAERAIAVVVFLGVAAMAVLSTSATALLGLMALGCVYLFDLATRLLNRDKRAAGTAGLELLLLSTVGLVAAIVMISQPELVDWLSGLADKILFQKTASASFRQRSLWTQTALEALLQTGGVGVGLGSVRTSNWMVSILASTGVFGSALMIGFILQRVFSRTVAPFQRSVKLWLAPTLLMSGIAGTIPDLGIMMSMMLGLLSLRPGHGAATAASVDRSIPSFVRPGGTGRAIALATRENDSRTIAQSPQPP